MRRQGPLTRGPYTWGLLFRARADQLLLGAAGDRDLHRLGGRDLRNLDRQHAGVEAGLDVGFLDVAGQLHASCEIAVRQLAAQVAALLGLGLLLVLGHDVQHAVAERDLDLLRLEARNRGLHLVGVALVHDVQGQVPGASLDHVPGDRRTEEVAEQLVHRRVQAGQLSHWTPATHRHLPLTSMSGFWGLESRSTWGTTTSSGRLNMPRLTALLGPV